MLAALMADTQAENTKLASNLESKLNKLSENLDAKLPSVAESLDSKLNFVSNGLNAKLNSMTTNVTSEMTKENDRMRQEFSAQLQNEVKSIAKEVDVVRENAGMELTKRARNFESAREGMDGTMNAYTSQPDANLNNLRLEWNYECL
jgi:DNA anti-recombination protein RmuC